MQQPIGVVMVFREILELYAKTAAGHWMVRIASYLHEFPVLDVI
jgi:hypothetical protein